MIACITPGETDFQKKHLKYCEMILFTIWSFKCELSHIWYISRHNKCWQAFTTFDIYSPDVVNRVSVPCVFDIIELSFLLLYYANTVTCHMCHQSIFKRIGFMLRWFSGRGKHGFCKGVVFGNFYYSSVLFQFFLSFNCCLFCFAS